RLSPACSRVTVGACGSGAARGRPGLVLAALAPLSAALANSGVVKRAGPSGLLSRLSRVAGVLVRGRWLEGRRGAFLARARRRLQGRAPGGAEARCMQPARAGLTGRH